MQLIILGSAAGGGFPQWNCTCPGCRAVRDRSRPCRARTQSGAAVSADGQNWVLLNASPDLARQLESRQELLPATGRDSPVTAVLLTDAELDNTLGLPLLREGSGVEVHATVAVHDVLCSGSGLLRLLAAYCPVRWCPVIPGREVPFGGGLSYRAFDAPTDKPARFGSSGGPGRVVGYRIADTRTGRFVVYLPGAQELTMQMCAQMDGCETLLVDGTCWSDQELIELHLACRTSRQMGHLPIGGPDGGLRAVRAISAGRTIFTHLNNTNPVLIEDSPQRVFLQENGAEVAHDGLELTL